MLTFFFFSWHVLWRTAGGSRYRLYCDKLPQGDTQGDTDSGTGAADGNDKEENFLKRKRRKRFKSSHDPIRSKDPVVAQVDDFFNQNFTPHLVLSSQNDPVPKAGVVIGTIAEQWLENVEVIAKHFNLGEWWEGTAKKQFHLIYPVACCILTLPDSNMGTRKEHSVQQHGWMAP